jgi:hypothetical protein
MADRVLRTNAYTTFDLLEGEVEGHGFSESALTVLNVTTDSRDDPEAVELEFELDNTDLDAVCPHADRVALSADQARDLAAELESYADRVDAGE